MTTPPTTAADLAVPLLADLADEALVDAARRAVDARTHRWVIDPDHPKVYGLLEVATDRACIIVYADEPSGHPDFEVSLEGEQMLSWLGVES